MSEPVGTDPAADPATDASEFGAGELGPEEPGTGGVGTGEVGTGEVGTGEVDIEVDIGEPAEASPVDDPAADQLPAVLAAALADPVELAAALEAILFVLDAPVSVATLAATLQQTSDAISASLDSLRSGYDERHAGIELREVAGGVRLYTRAAHADVVEHFLRDGQRSRLSQAALETLAVIAYRQPVTRARVSAIRGVNVDGVVRTLLARGLVVEVGTDPETGGGLYRTTELFLQRMGLRSLDELPSLAPLLPGVDAVDALAADEL